MGDSDPRWGTEILQVVGNENDPNWQDVQPHDAANYLRERQWLQKWSKERWKYSGPVNIQGATELRLQDLGRKLDDPGDAFFDFLMWAKDSQSLVKFRTWVEVTEVFVPGQERDVNVFIKAYNNLRGGDPVNASNFLRCLNLELPVGSLQTEMADRVIGRIEAKARKGDEGGSYRQLARDYGRGALVVGLPLWFAVLPSTVQDPSHSDDFLVRLASGFHAIEKSVLRATWCPFDSVVVLWHPSTESIDSWTRAADRKSWSDESAVAWQSLARVAQMPALLKSVGKIAQQQGHRLPAARFHVRWDRFSSLDPALADQREQNRPPNEPLPFGPKSELEIFSNQD